MRFVSTEVVAGQPAANVIYRQRDFGVQIRGESPAGEVYSYEAGVVYGAESGFTHRRAVELVVFMKLLSVRRPQKLQRSAC